MRNMKINNSIIKTNMIMKVICNKLMQIIMVFNKTNRAYQIVRNSLAATYRTMTIVSLQGPIKMSIVEIKISMWTIIRICMVM